MKSHDLEPDRGLTSDDEKLIAQLSEDDVRSIDDALLSNTKERWQKVAMVVATTMLEKPGRIIGLPDIYYSSRIQNLVKEGRLESRGDLSRMRYSEVRKCIRDET